MDVQELRTAFLLTETTREGVRNFRADRLSKIAAGETPAPLQQGLRIILHTIPLSGFDSRERFEASKLASLFRPGELGPIYSSAAYESKCNFDGFLISDQYGDRRTASSYLQMFRNGAFESVNTLVVGTAGKVIPGIEFEGRFLHNLPTYLAAWKKLGIQLPVLLALSLTGLKGYSIYLDHWAAVAYHQRGNSIEVDTLLLPEAVLESFDAPLDAVLKPCFDTFWNAGGYMESIYYEGSKWIGDQKFQSRR